MYDFLAETWEGADAVCVFVCTVRRMVFPCLISRAVDPQVFRLDILNLLAEPHQIWYKPGRYATLGVCGTVSEICSYLPVRIA